MDERIKIPEIEDGEYEENIDIDELEDTKDLSNLVEEVGKNNE